MSPLLLAAALTLLALFLTAVIAALLIERRTAGDGGSLREVNIAAVGGPGPPADGQTRRPLCSTP